MAATSIRDRGPGTFIVTKEHRRFVEFAQAVRRQRCIGLCFGPAGVGKTLSARRYAHWDLAEPFLLAWGPRDPADAKVHAALARSRTVFYTPSVGGAFRGFRGELEELICRVGRCVSEAAMARDPNLRIVPTIPVELLIVDEAERLSTTGLEYVRDLFDRSPLRGIILIGMPGLEKRLARYPQLYSRVGFAHPYRALRDDELAFVLARHWRKLGLELDGTDFTDAQALAAVARLTGGNFRLLQRLLVQIGRILRINELTTVTDEVVEAARRTLIIGAT